MHKHYFAASFVLLAACSGGTDTEPDPVDEQPVWNGSPAMLALAEGRSESLTVDAMDPDGGEVTINVTTMEGVRVDVATDELRVHALYGTTEGSFQVDITDDEGTTTSVVVPVTITQLGWQERETWSTVNGPEEREHASVFYEQASGKAFMFGGSGYNPYGTQMMEDFWQYDTATSAWTAITATGDVPGGAGSRRFAGEWGKGTGVVFGGYSNAGNLADVYRVTVQGDSLVFDELTNSANAPSGRALHAFVFDPQTERYFLFGGVTNTPLSDTWMMEVQGDNANWTQLELPNSPSARYGSFYGFDEQAGRLILFSGAQGLASISPANDTWSLDVRSDPPVWTLLAEGDAVPPGRRNGCAVWDPSGSRLLVFGGTPDGMTTAPGVFAFDARPGQMWWSVLDREGPPPLRSSGFGFASDERMYLGFGNSSTAIYRDWGVLGY